MSHSWVFIGLMLLCTVLAGMASAETIANTSEQPLTVGISESDTWDANGIALPLQEKINNLTDFVKKGVAFAKDNSKEEAIALFNDVTGEFVNGDQYIFAYDMNCTTLALPYEQELIGKDRSGKTDPNGMAYIQALKYIAEYGGGYIYYVRENPALNMTKQVKLSYIEPVDDTWFIGSGIYLPHITGSLSNETIVDLKARVEKAATFGKTEGKEKASAAFNDRNGTWAKGSDYIFAYDFNGTVLALPFTPESIGENRMNWTDKYGSPTVRLAIDFAKTGGGFTYIVINNPDNGKDELKLFFVLPVQDDWMVGSGIYLGADLSEGNGTV